MDSSVIRCEHTVYKDDFTAVIRRHVSGENHVFQWIDPQGKLEIWAGGIHIDMDGATEPGGQSDPAAGTTGTRTGITLHLDYEKLFTRLRTSLPEHLWSLPVGYFAMRFRHDGAREENPGWQDWPRRILRIPRVILINDLEAQRIHEIIFQSLGAATLEDHAPLSVEGQGRHAPCGSSADDAWRQIEDPTTWCERVGSAERACSAGIISKVVLGRSSTLHLPAGKVFDVRQTLAALETHYPNTITFRLQHNEESFLGATPEVLAVVDDGTVKTHALAGTVALHSAGGTTATADGMLTDPKLRREHQYVVQDICETLQGIASDIRMDDSPSIRHLGQLAHLQTNIFGLVPKNVSILAVTELLHPTPALGGTPRDLAMAWLKESESLERGFYGGPFGWFNAWGDGACAVAIRCGLMSERRAVAFAGAGIVKGSIGTEEFDETESKMDAFRSNLVVRTLIDRPVHHE